MQYSARGSIISLDLEKLIDNMPSAVLIVDYNLSLRMINKQAERFVGGLRKKMVGMGLGEIFKCINANNAKPGCGSSDYCETCLAIEMIKDLIQQKSPKSITEAQLEVETYGRRDIKITAVNLFEEETVLVIIDDETELNKLERDRVVKDKLQAAMETAGAICHEMNQPLQVISGYLDLLLATGMEPENDGAKYLRISREQLDRLTAIVRKFDNLRRYRTDKYPGGGEILDIAKSSAG